jgi:hypothetical protein
MKYIYVIASSTNGPSKIGISEKPSKRLKQLQTGHAEKLFLYHSEAVENARLYEGLFHKNLNHKRTHGEWFDLNVEDAIAHIQFTLIEYEPSDLTP